MPAESNESFKMKIFPKGQVVIPASLRKRYRMDIGEQIDVISTPDGILLKPLRKKDRQKSLTGKLFGIFNSYASGKPQLTERDIEKATATGFIEEWQEWMIWD